MFMHGHEFNEAPKRSCAGAKSSMRPPCTHAQGSGFQSGPSALMHRG